MSKKASPAPAMHPSLGQGAEAVPASAVVRREQPGWTGAAPISTDEAAGDAETEHKFLVWSSARAPGLVLLAASATRLLTTRWSGFGFYIIPICRGKD